METEKERKLVDGVEVIVTSVNTKLDKNGQEVFKIEFETERLVTITYKPTIETTQVINGMNVKSTKQPTIMELPKIITEIAQECQRTGRCKVLATFQYWKPAENNPDGKEYRYVQGSKMMDKWKIVPFVVPTETIKDY